MTSISESTNAHLESAGAGRQTSPRVSFVLWLSAFVLAATAMIYQRRTGPTYPLHGEFQVAGNSYSYTLIRTHESTEDAPVQIPSPGSGAKARLFYKRYHTDDAFQPLEMNRTAVETSEGERTVLEARLPKQPAAGKLEYHVQLETPEGTIRLPESPSENVIIRFKDPVPSAVLIPHITMMILTILLGMRAGLAALFAPGPMRLYSWLTLAAVTLGGMILGPIVQKFAFGEFWTGFPHGGDWTDNKALFMWLAWLAACMAAGISAKKNERPVRVVVFAATLVMAFVYLIPHSMGGSELDYSQVDRGVDPANAIETGRR